MKIVLVSGCEVHVRVCDRREDRERVRMYHGRRDGSGQDAAVHHVDVDSPATRARGEAHRRQGGHSRSQFSCQGNVGMICLAM